MKSKLPLILINLSLISSPLGANAAKIYTCTINGETVYTTKPSKSCHSTDLPPIGNYSSERYILPQTPEPAPSPSNGGQAVKYKAPVKTVSKPAKSNTPPQQAPVNNSRRSILEAELSNCKAMFWTDSKISKHCKENWDVCKAVFSNRPFQGFDRRNDEKAGEFLG